MKILVRLPNWLGDMVMSVGFIHQLPHFFPGAEISVIAKKGIHYLLPYFPPTHHQFIFSKEEYKGMSGLWRFGKYIRQTEKFDLFFCLPDSFSSALMGYATGAGRRVGYKKEARNILLTNVYNKPKALHRVAEYIALLEYFTAQRAQPANVSLQHSVTKGNHIVININSEAQSRRLTIPKAIELINEVRSTTTVPVYLIGAPNEQAFVSAVYAQLATTHNINNVAGRTSFPELVQLLASAQVMITTDSGPAHLANALQTKTIVLFGAGNEANTAPYNKDACTVMRLGKLSCEPCTKNVCVRYETPQCLVQLSTEKIVATALKKMHHEPDKF